MNKQHVRDRRLHIKEIKKGKESSYDRRDDEKTTDVFRWKTKILKGRDFI